MALISTDSPRFGYYRQRSQQIASGFTPGQKAMVLIAAIGLVIAVVTFYRSESKPQYGVLFSGMAAKDAGAVTAALQSNHVPYQLSDGGATVSVPQSDVNKERVALAQAGLPSDGTVGFTALTKSGITTSDFVQQVEYQQALEGQLSSTIESINGIQGSKVTLAIPSQSPFALNSGPAPQASVLVDLAPGASLSASQVQAIVHLAASSVPGLDPSNVTVVDEGGNVLSAPGVSLGAATQQQQTDTYDTTEEQAIQSMLDRVVGPENADVQVHATLNFDQVDTTTQSVPTDAAGKPLVAPVSQQSTTETYAGNAAPPSGVLGSGQPPVNQNQSGNYTKTDTQTTNAMGQVTQVVHGAPGSVQSATVAVLVNSRAANGVTPAQISNLVRTAAGLPANQAANVTVEMVPFSTAASTQAATAAKAAASAKKSATIRQAAEAAALVALLAVIFFLALRAARRRPPAYEEIPLPGMLAQAEVFDPMELPATPTTEIPSLGDALRGDIDKYIDDHPDEVARLLRSWASERRRPERAPS